MSTIGKALSLLDTVAALDREAGLSEIARASQLDKATTRRFLVELERHGFLEQDQATRKYRIGSAPLRLAQIREARLPLLHHAVPILRLLSARTGETVHMSQFSAGRLSTIHSEESPRANRVIVKVGTWLPFHASASGIAFLSASPTTLVDAYLGEPLERFTPYTITDPEEMRTVLRETAARGYSIGRQGLEGGMTSVASPILSPGKPPIGCVAIAAPMVRADDAAVVEFGTAAREAATTISELLFPRDPVTTAREARSVASVRT